jgi:rhodanese-related sulfurtransferase
MKWRKPVLQGIALLGLALACAAVSNAAAGKERRLAWIGHYEAAGPARPATAPPATAASAPASASGANAFPPHPDRPWVEISTDQAAELFRQGVLFFDARRSGDYRAGHVAGARSFPVWEEGIDEKVKGFYAEGPDQSAPIVVYCSGGACEDSHMLAQKLYLAGFDDALVYRDGFPEWQKRGLPIRTGDQP